MSNPFRGRRHHPSLRATVSETNLFLVYAWTDLADSRRAAEVLASRGGGELTLVDLTVDLGLGWRDVIASPITPTSSAADRALTAWAWATDHRILWRPDAVVHLADRPCESALASVECPVCGCRWEDDRPEFWSGVWAQGAFPMTCEMCGGLLPQWRLEGEIEPLESVLELPPSPERRTPQARGEA